MASDNFQSRISSSSSSSSKYIPLHKTQLHPRMHHPFSLSSPTKSGGSHHHKPLLLIISLSLFPFFLYLLSLYGSLHLPSPASFGLVIEIAHSHSEIRVFRSLNEVSGTPFSGESSHSMWVRPGIIGSDSEDVGRAVLKLVEFAKGKVPSSEWLDTKVQLMITAGDDELGAGYGERVLQECRRVLRSSRFFFKEDWASILGGQDEGLYNWLAVNYAFGYIGKKPQETAGVIVLGRSAMQVSYASSKSPLSKSSRVMKLAGVSYNLYAQSLQQFGQDVLWNVLHEKDFQNLTSSSRKNGRIVSNPCIPRGLELTWHASDEKHVKSHAAGNFSTCKSELLTLLNRIQEGKCARPPCELASSILNELERKPHPQQGFFLSSQFQGLVPKATALGVEAVGGHFCEDDWENLKRKYDIDNFDLSRRCFSHAFMAILLQQGFGILFDDKIKRVEFPAGSTPVDWKLGAFLTQTIMEPLEHQEEDQETQIIGNESITYFLLFAVVLVFVVLAAFFVMKLRRPQLKTIYDLEKGRYIVTRVPR